MIRQGADVPSCLDHNFNTPLHLAVAADQPDCVRVLLDEGGADVLALDAAGRTALDLAEAGSYDFIVRMLHEHLEQKILEQQAAAVAAGSEKQASAEEQEAAAAAEGKDGVAAAAVGESMEELAAAARAVSKPEALAAVHEGRAITAPAISSSLSPTLLARVQPSHLCPEPCSKE